MDEREIECINLLFNVTILRTSLPRIVDDIVDELEKNPQVKECYENWFRMQVAVYGYYKDSTPMMIPLSENKEFKSIKNMIIRTAIEMDVQHTALTEAAPTHTLRLLKMIEKMINDTIPNSDSSSSQSSDTKQMQKELSKREAHT